MTDFQDGRSWQDMVRLLHALRSAGAAGVENFRATAQRWKKFSLGHVGSGSVETQTQEHENLLIHSLKT